MLRPALMVLLLLASCSKGSQADLPYISEARSLGAEWAMVNEQAAEGKLSGTYVETMRQSVREQLRTASRSLTKPDSRYGVEIAALLAQPDDAAPEKLRAHADNLKQIEDSLESA
jgi:hypothetical protein